MIQNKNSFKGFKQESIYQCEDSQIPFPKDSIQTKGFGFYDLLLIKIKACPFIVDWELYEIEQSTVDKANSQ